VPPPLIVKLAQDVVEQKHGRFAEPVLDDRCLSEKQRQDCETLLPLRSEGSQLAAAGRDRKIVEMWAGTC